MEEVEPEGGRKRPMHERRPLDGGRARRCHPLFLAWTLLMLCVLAAAGRATAQSNLYDDLDAAVSGLAQRLASTADLAGKPVLVTPHDFFDEDTGRHLPLSETLSRQFRAALSGRDVQVVVDAGSKDEIATLQGQWSAHEEAGLDLTVWVRKRLDDRDVLSALVEGRISHVAEDLLQPNLEFLGRQVVRMLERDLRTRDRLPVHVGDRFSYDGDDAADPARLRRYLERHWLRPAFSRSRRFDLAGASVEGAEGAGEIGLYVFADPDSDHLMLSLDILDGERRLLSTAAVDAPKTLFPPAVLGSNGGRTAAAMLRRCTEAEEAGRAAEAWKCYGEVLERDAENTRAQTGRERIEADDVEAAEAALGRGDCETARRHVTALAGMNPGHSRVGGLEGEVTRCEAGTELAPEMVRIRGGCFRMGSPGAESGRGDDERQHEVCVEAFSIGKYEVTRGEYAKFVEATGRKAGDGCWTYEDGEWERRTGRSWDTPGYEQGDGHPVVCVSWEDATAYAQWLSEETGRRYRLPKEAEWEYAARAGTQTSRYWGEDPSGACEDANVGDRTLKERRPNWRWAIHECDDGQAHTASVGSFEANGWGLHDMLGNVWEWTCSEWDEGYRGSETRCASGGDGVRVFRGASWHNASPGVRSANRSGSAAGGRGSTVGFRLAQD